LEEAKRTRRQILSYSRNQRLYRSCTWATNLFPS